MQQPALRFTLSLFALTLIAANASRADRISFSWQSTITPSSIPADQAVKGGLGFVGLGGAGLYTPLPSWNDMHAVGATYLTVPFYNATYSDKPLTLTLKLTDGPSGLSDVSTFHGILSGGGYALPSLSFSDGVRYIQIGQDIYHIQMPETWLNGFEPYPYPDIFAKIDISTISNTPEPSSLLLAAMALTALGFARWRRSRG